jgi:hypothetical protein
VVCLYGRHFQASWIYWCRASAGRNENCMIGKCASCPHSGYLHRDHIFARWKAKRDGWSKAQTEAPSNIQYLCGDCHIVKTKQDLQELRLSPGYKEKASAAAKNSLAMQAHHASRKGVPQTPAIRAKLSAVRKNSLAIAANCRKLGAAKKGIPLSHEQRSKMSLSRRELWQSPEYRAKQLAARSPEKRLERARQQLLDAEKEIERTS